MKLINHGKYVLVSLLAITSLSISVLPIANAETGSGGTIQLLINYCHDHATDKVDPACNTGNMTDVANAAAQLDKCTSASAGDFANCIVSQGESQIIKPALKGATTAAEFKANLAKVIKKLNVDPNKSVPNTSLNPDTSCPSTGCEDQAIKCTQDRCDFIGKYINPAITAFTAAFGVIAVISLIAGGITYASSAGDPQKVAQGKKRIFNTIVALIAYFFLYGFLQFLIPGGLFNRGG